MDVRQLIAVESALQTKRRFSTADGVSNRSCPAALKNAANSKRLMPLGLAFFNLRLAARFSSGDDCFSAPLFASIPRPLAAAQSDLPVDVAAAILDVRAGMVCQ
jgi:hypothetical protein